MLTGWLAHWLLPLVDAARHVFAADTAYGLRKCVQALPILLNLRGQARYARLIREPHTLPLTTRYPRLAYKWLGHSLSRRFSARTRLRVCVSHYVFLQATTPVHFLGRLFEQPLPLWDSQIEAHQFCVMMGFPRPDDQEGDVSLTFEMDGLPLCTASFVFCDGALVGGGPDPVMLVARMQGGSGCFDRVKEATRICHDIAPADILMAALSGIAAAFGIAVMLGVSTRDQVSRHLKEGVSRFFDYDRFWLSYGAVASAGGLHRIVLPYPEKRMDDVRSKHRSRTRRKREFKGRLAASVTGICRHWVSLPRAEACLH
jgi:uncharacterized protein